LRVLVRLRVRPGKPGSGVSLRRLLDADFGADHNRRQAREQLHDWDFGIRNWVAEHCESPFR